MLTFCEQVDSGYPLSITQYWFNCKAENQESNVMEADLMDEHQVTRKKP